MKDYIDEMVREAKENSKKQESDLMKELMDTRDM